MTRRTTQVIGVALALLVGALYVAAPLCLMPVCGVSMGTATATRVAIVGHSAHAERIGAECSAPRPRSVVVTADRPAFSLAGVVQAPLVFLAPATGAEVLLAVAEAPPPDPLGDSSRLRL